MSQNPETTNSIQQPVTVLIIGDHGLFRAGVRSELAKCPQQAQIVGKTATVEEAIATVTKIKPQVALLDVYLPNGHDGRGVEVAAAPGNEVARSLVLSVPDTTEDAVAVIHAGAYGYVIKTISTPDLVDSIIQVAEGDATFFPQLTGFVLGAFGAARSEIVETDNELDSLANREFEVMHLIACSYAYKETTSELYISIRTVKSHVSAMLRRLQLSNRYELSRWAAKRRIN